LPERSDSRVREDDEEREKSESNLGGCGVVDASDAMPPASHSRIPKKFATLQHREESCFSAYAPSMVNDLFLYLDGRGSITTQKGPLKGRRWGPVAACRNLIHGIFPVQEYE
jgi:hypothetical protein